MSTGETCPRPAPDSAPRLALVTGASRGIGRAIAERLARDGFSTALVCRNRLEDAETLARLLRAEGCHAAAFRADISEETEVNDLFEAVRREFGHLPDVLVNNAGIALSGVLADQSAADFDRIFSVNVRGMFLTCRAVYDAMVSNRWGRIINISSMWGVCGASCEVLYSASKAAVIGFSKALALELGPSGVTVNVVAPGVIRTDMLSCYDEETLSALAEETPVGRLGTPEDIASAVSFFASDGASFVTGQVLGANGGFIT